MILFATVLRDRLQRGAREEAGTQIGRLSQSPRPQEVVTWAALEVELLVRRVSKRWV